MGEGKVRLHRCPLLSVVGVWFEKNILGTCVKIVHSGATMWKLLGGLPNFVRLLNKSCFFHTLMVHFDAMVVQQN